MQSQVIVVVGEPPSQPLLAAVVPVRNHRDHLLYGMAHRSLTRLDNTRSRLLHALDERIFVEIATPAGNMNEQDSEAYTNQILFLALSVTQGTLRENKTFIKYR